jgi:hypothetical protein
MGARQRVLTSRFNIDRSIILTWIQESKRPPA